MQYIDSRGCVFLRAGMGGTVNWVPRVGQDRKVLCGYPPTFGGKQVEIATVPDEVPMTEPMAAAPRVATVAPKPLAVAQAPMRQSVAAADYVPPPARVGTVIPTGQIAPAAAQPLVVAVRPGVSVGSVAGQVGCPASAPRLQRLALTNGGTVLVCTPGDGALRNLRAPVFADGAGVGAAFEDTPQPVARVAPSRVAEIPLGQASGQGRPTVNVRVAQTVSQAPVGYTVAWKDDRLNPLRGVGTAAGQAAQDQVWTRKTPAKLVGDTRKARREAARARVNGTVLVVSTMSAPTEPVAPVAARQGGYYVQAGSFGVPSNAEGALARLAAAGLPVARGRANGLTVVMAGPFGSPAEAAAARGIARSAGFGDAFVR
ncbi:SPOR domain-containing protein [Paragemmobacter aquarius]|nr:SPOR domain-containing protein [Gemmobacter aquarius]